MLKWSGGCYACNSWNGPVGGWSHMTMVVRGEGPHTSSSLDYISHGSTQAHTSPNWLA